MYKYLIASLLFATIVSTIHAQDIKPDTLRRPTDTDNSAFMPKKKIDNRVYHPDSLHKPGKAVLRSLIVPGWGQLYNHQWYFVPVIYAGMGLLVDGIIFNQNNYKPTLLVARDFKYATPPAPGAPEYKLYNQYKDLGSSLSYVEENVDSYHRDRDLCIMGLVAAWGVQAIQAYIQAKFEQSYTMDTNLSIKISPTVINQQQLYAANYNSPAIPGIRLTFVLR